MIDLVDVFHHYGVRPTLKGVSLHVRSGELVCVMGPNGMGKSTLLAVAAGVLAPIDGEVRVDGIERRSSVANEKAIRQKVLYLPDDPWLPVAMTGREYVLGVGRVYGVDDARLMANAERLLELFYLDEKADQAIGGYSTGQKKKIGLCAALASEARVLILDEPFSGGLDSAALHALMTVLKALAEREDMTILMAAPVPELIEGLAHRVAVIHRGEIIAYDTIDGLRKRAGTQGSLANVLDALLNPGGQEKVKQFLAGWRRD
ncbi:MAG: ABC transporter ATP-binding protein [Planctomycetota bacterium]